MGLAAPIFISAGATHISGSAAGTPSGLGQVMPQQEILPPLDDARQRRPLEPTLWQRLAFMIGAVIIGAVALGLALVVFAFGLAVAVGVAAFILGAIILQRLLR